MNFAKSKIHKTLCLAGVKDMTLENRIPLYFELMDCGAEKEDYGKIKKQLFADAYILANNRQHYPECTIAERETLDTAYRKIYLYIILRFDFFSEYARYCNAEHKKMTA